MHVFAVNSRKKCALGTRNNWLFVGSYLNPNIHPVFFTDTSYLT